jgi:hypothetical protein
MNWFKKETAPGDIEKYLVSVGWDHVVYGSEIGIRCPWCDYGARHPDKTCSINGETGWGKCHHSNRCTKGGFNFYELRKQTGDPELQSDRDMEPRRTEYSQPKPLSEAPLTSKQECAKYFAERGLDARFARDRFGVSATEIHGSPALVFPYFDDGVEVDRKYRARDGKDGKPWKHFSRETNCPGLFGKQNVKDSCPHLILTGGELDTLAWAELGVQNVVNGPAEKDFGWIAEHWDWLQGFQTFFIATDSDKTGQEAAAEIAKRLGPERCYRIELPKGCKDCLDAKVVAGWDADEVELAMAMAKDFKPAKLRHISDFTEEAFSRPESAAWGDLSPWTTLNEILKGFRPSEMTLWAGDDGTGKTTLLFNLMRAFLDSGVGCCIGSFELRPVRQAGWLGDMVGRDKAVMDAWNLWLVSHVGCIDPKELLSYYIYAARRYGCTQFLTDSMTMLGVDDDDYQAQSAFAKAIKQELVDPYNVHHHLICHTRKGKTDATTGRDKQSARGAASVKNVHDNMLLIFRDAEFEGGNIKTFLRLIKAREHGSGAKDIELTMNQEIRTFTEVHPKPEMVKTVWTRNSHKD